MRWVLILIAMAGFAGAFLVRTPGLLGLCLLVAFVGAVGAVFAIAHARIEGNARTGIPGAVDAATFKSALRKKTSSEDHTTTPS